MTKIKNTKKGMAKKTLSMSLVVAMLATSNVPVWAAEFSDGTDAAVETEAPAAETFSDDATEAPVVENTTDVTDVATATAPKLTLANWTGALAVSGDLKDGSTDVANFDYKVRIDGKEVVGHSGTYTGSATSVADLNGKLTSATFVSTDAGHIVSVEITGTGANAGFKTTIEGIEIKSVDVSSATLNLGGATVAYTGKQVAFSDTQIAGFTIAGISGLSYNDFKYTYEGDDLVNATPAGKTLQVVATVDKAGYTGQIKAPFIINKRTLNPDKLELTLKKNTVSYAERSKISSDYVTVKDTVTGETLPTSVYTVTGNGLTAVGTESTLSIATDSLDKDEKTNRNYTGNVTKVTTDKVKVVANQMSDFKIVTDSIGKDDASNATAVKNAIHFYIGDTEVTSYISSAITVAPATLASGATTLSVSVNGDNTNVIGNTTVNLSVTLNKLTAEGLTYKIGSGNDQTANENTNLGVETYTGAAITKDIKDVKFVITGANNQKTTVNLSTSDYKVEYVNDNTNAKEVSKKDVEVYIVGTGNYSGRVKIGTFTIQQAEIEATDITAPEKVQYNGSLQTVADYMDGKVTVKAGVAGKKKDVPADAYKLTYATEDGNPVAVGSRIVTTLDAANIKNKNYKITGTSINNASKSTLVTNKDIADTNVKLEIVGSYTYTGKAITPTVKLSVDGVELAQDIDYTIKSCTNNVNAGEATVTVEGKGDYSGTQTAKFTINKANLSDVKVEAKTNTVDEKEVFTYTGNQVKPTAPDFKITLNGVTLNASDFAITYPTTSKVNVNAGDASVTLVPVKTNANFTGDTKKVEFKILPRAISEIASKKGTVQLTGTFYAFDENGDRIDFSKTGYTFGYDGTEKTFKDIKFVPTVNGAKLVEGKDYEIKYFNNVTGPDAYVYVAGIGNYTNDSDQKFTGSDQTFAVKSDVFKIEGVTVGRKNITVADTEYAGGVAVTPNVTIKVGEKTLVEGTDYEFTGLSNNADVTGVNKVLKATLKLKNGYKLSSSYSDEWKGVFSNPNTTNNTVDVTWKIVKKNLANTTISISETNGKLTATVLNGNVVVPSAEYDVKDNGDGTATVTAKADSKGYTGSQKVSVKKSENVGAPVISSVKVVGNKATVILSGEADGVSGYDYVISTDRDCIKNKNYDSISKNQVQTSTTFKYVQQGTYYAYCHAWKRDENGKKVFGEWSNAYPFSVTAITPDAPVITNVTVSGSTIKVTYKAATNATGYDVVLGTSSKKENGETRPYNYGTYKKLNLKEGTVTATFKNVSKGTWVVGMHAFNRTSEDGKKVFSPWSNLKKATVK
ncbi:hypothetical protein [Blautia sp.]